MLKRRTIYMFFKSSIPNEKKKEHNSNGIQTLAFFISECRRLIVLGLLTTFTSVTVRLESILQPTNIAVFS